MTDSLPSTTTGPDSAAVGRLVARERVRAMEGLAGIIAHEIRSAVLGVTSAAQLLRYAVPQDPVAEKSLGRILQESERLSSLHEALSEYATEVPPRLAPSDPDRLWDSVITNMRGALEANSVLLRHSSAEEPASCLIDEHQMTRAFERIIHHAIARGQTGCELEIASSVQSDRGWRSTISIAGASGKPGNSDYERPTFLLALANRTLVAHGGEVIDHSGEASAGLVSIRLPLAPPTE